MTRGEHPGRDRDRTRERDHGRLSTQRDLRYRAMSWLTPDLPEVPSPCQPPRATPLDNTGDPLTTWPWVVTVALSHCAGPDKPGPDRQPGTGRCPGTRGAHARPCEVTVVAIQIQAAAAQDVNGLLPILIAALLALAGTAAR